MKKKLVQFYKHNDENREYRYAGIKLGYVRLKEKYYFLTNNSEDTKCYEIYKFKLPHVELIKNGQVTNSIYPEYFTVHIDNVIFISESEYITSEVIES